VSGVRNGRAIRLITQVTNQPGTGKSAKKLGQLGNQPDEKNQPNGLATTKLTTTFGRPERSLKQPAHCKLKTANYLKKMQVAIRLRRKVL